MGARGGHGLWVAFIFAAIFVVWQPSRPTSLIGATVSDTPRVIFTSAAVSSSDAEVAWSQ